MVARTKRGVAPDEVKAKKAAKTAVAEPKAAKVSADTKIPKTVGACADLLYTLRQKRYEIQKQADELSKMETKLSDYIIENLPKSDAEGVAGKLARVQIIKKENPVVEDWDVFYKYVSRTKSFDLLQRRLSATAVQERWSDKKLVPGVGKFTSTSLSLNKL